MEVVPCAFEKRAASGAPGFGLAGRPLATDATRRRVGRFPSDGATLRGKRRSESINFTDLSERRVCILSRIHSHKNRCRSLFRGRCEYWYYGTSTILCTLYRYQYTAGSYSTYSVACPAGHATCKPKFTLHQSYWYSCTRTVGSSYLFMSSRRFCLTNSSPEVCV